MTLLFLELLKNSNLAQILKYFRVNLPLN